MVNPEVGMTSAVFSQRELLRFGWDEPLARGAYCRRPRSRVPVRNLGDSVIPDRVALGTGLSSNLC
jgi:hypothetical protein